MIATLIGLRGSCSLIQRWGWFSSISFSRKLQLSICAERWFFFRKKAPLRKLLIAVAAGPSHKTSPPARVQVSVSTLPPSVENWMQGCWQEIHINYWRKVCGCDSARTAEFPHVAHKRTQPALLWRWKEPICNRLPGCISHSTKGA